MNFERMPELGIPWAYPALLGIMGAMAIGLLLFFKKERLALAVQPFSALFST